MNVKPINPKFDKIQKMHQNREQKPNSLTSIHTSHIHLCTHD